MMERILVPGAVRQFATAMHDAAGSGHHVASPMGAWLLLALIGDSANGLARSTVERALGMNASAAEEVARHLLDTPHPALALATAAWVHDEWRNDALAAWERRLPRSAERGPIPTKRQADEWARQRTRGLIDRFPVDIQEYTRLVLSTVLATTVTWAEPFELADARELWPTDDPPVSQVLRAVPKHQMFIATTSVGDVAVHAARSADGLMVVSVAAPPGVAHTEVMDAAYRIADALANSPHRLRIRSLFDLPLGDHAQWSITEEPVWTSEPDGREERFEALLPAWTAHTHHDLLKSERLGFVDAARAFVAMLDQSVPGTKVEGAQSVVATYSREGFSAGAVSALAFAPVGAPASSRSGVRRTATLRFAGPYAVVAVAIDQNWVPGAPIAPSGWHGLPVFSAWVTEYIEPEPESEDAE
ncbi:MAG TPA: serpin family protein [Micromonospora sp.]